MVSNPRPRTAQSKAAVTVVGDVILDRYTITKQTRDNPEGTGKVYQVTQTMPRLGGAAHVACQLQCWNREVYIGHPDYEDNRQINRMLRHQATDTDFAIQRITPTPDNRVKHYTIKDRLVVDGKLWPHRIDHDDDTPIDDKAAVELALQVNGYADRGHVLIVQDYGKGTVTNHLMQNLSAPTIILDPHSSRDDWATYYDIPGLQSRCQHLIIKANAREAIAEHGSPDAIPAPPKEIAHALGKRHCCTIIVTAGEGGIFLSNGQVNYHQAALRVEPIDPCGAGDTIAAAFAHQLAADGGDFIKATECAEWAALTAAIQVTKSGAWPITEADLESDGRAILEGQTRGLC